jgi:mono/diheme cytochrome c family protein
MFRLCLLQLPCILVVIVCAAFMARGLGLPTGTAALPSHPGAALYTRHCAPCHQADGRALGGKTAGDFVGDPAILAQPDAVLLDVIARGKTGTIGTMPAWGHVLTPADQRAVLAYLRAAFAPPP